MFPFQKRTLSRLKSLCRCGADISWRRRRRRLRLDTMERNSSMMSLCVSFSFSLFLSKLTIRGGGCVRNAHSTSKKKRSKLFNLPLLLLPAHRVRPALRHLVSSTVNSHDGNGQTLSRPHLSRLPSAGFLPGRNTCRNGRCQNPCGVLLHAVVRVIC